MRFTYQYKTSDGIRHEGSCSAASKAAVYDELKKSGVRPFNVELAPGFWNRVLSFGGVTIFLTLVSLVAVVFAAFVWLRSSETVSSSVDDVMPRHKIYGDPALLADLSRNGYTNVFAHPVDCFLARFAQPGVGVANVSRTESETVCESMRTALDLRVRPEPGEVREIQELKRIVLWMKDEIRNYLSDGVGTPESYVRRLYERQREEISIYNRIRAEVKSMGRKANLEEVNASLRRLGLPTIVSATAQFVK